jgi:hypothetical protein
MCVLAPNIYIPALHHIDFPLDGLLDGLLDRTLATHQ